MERMQQRMMGVWERARFIMYGLAVGLLLGMILGWIFHGFVGTLFRIIIVALILAPFVLAVIFWQRINNRNREERERVVVRSPDSDRILVVQDDTDPVAIRDGEWREGSRDPSRDPL